MKRFGVLLLILAVVLCVCLMGPRMFRKIGADLGSFSGDSDYGSDSGSDSGWDSGWDSGSDYGSGNGFYFFPIGSSGSGGSDSGGFGSLLFWVVLILIVIIIMSRRSQHSSTPHAGTAAGAARTPDSQLTPMSEYAALDPNFSVSDMQEKLSNIYVQMQNGCTARNIEPLRPYFTDALYQQFDRQIKSLVANRRINCVERIAVLDVNLRGFFQEGGDDHLVAELKTRITDYTVAEDTGAVLSGSKTAEKFMTYEWDLSRPTGTITEKQEAVTERHCPNCGAPLSVNESAKCPYCDSVITFKDHDWTIYAVKGIAQRTVQS
jgi:DNA-directed RNA polymerase subunit RPC12/RpoP